MLFWSRLVVDYVARAEQLDTDMAEVLTEINRRRPAGMPAVAIPDRMPLVRPSNTGVPCESVQLSARHRVSGRPASFFGVVQNFTSIIAKESSYCSMQQFYSGRHERCRRSIQRVYGADLRLLYPHALDQQPSNATDPG